MLKMILDAPDTDIPSKIKEVIRNGFAAKIPALDIVKSIKALDEYKTLPDEVKKRLDVLLGNIGIK
ncbi:MAG: hypothetical protein WCK88_05075 [bacterium]